MVLSYPVPANKMAENGGSFYLATPALKTLGLIHTLRTDFDMCELVCMHTIMHTNAYIYVCVFSPGQFFWGEGGGQVVLYRYY